MAPARQSLSYEAKEPPFLAKLRVKQAGSDADSDRHERAVPRPMGKKEYLARRGGDEDDGPTIVEEDGNTLSKEEFEARVAGAEESENKDELTNTENAVDPTREASVEGKAKQQSAKDSMVRMGAKPSGSKKRKIVPVDDGEIEEEECNVEGQPVKSKPERKKLAKKRKDIKLSFNEEG